MKTIPLLIVLLTLLLAGKCNKSSDLNSCIDENLKSDDACYEIYAPVCGCDGITYSNDCYAKVNGVSSWEEGSCNNE